MNNNNMNMIHEMWEKLMDMGFTKEECIELVRLGFEVTNRIVNEEVK